MLLGHKQRWSDLPQIYCIFSKVTYDFELISLPPKTKWINPTYMWFCSDLPQCPNTTSRYVEKNPILTLFYCKVKSDPNYPSSLYAVCVRICDLAWEGFVLANKYARNDVYGCLVYW